MEIKVTSAAPFDSKAAQAALAAADWGQPVRFANGGPYRRQFPELGLTLQPQSAAGDTLEAKFKDADQFIRVVGTLSRRIAVNGDTGGISIVLAEVPPAETPPAEAPRPDPTESLRKAVPTKKPATITTTAATTEEA